MGLWEQIVNGKVKKCLYVNINYSIDADSTIPIANDFLYGKVIFSRDCLTFENKNGSYFCQKMPFIGTTGYNQYVYEETLYNRNSCTSRFIMDKDGGKGKFLSSLGEIFDQNKIYIDMDLKFN